jgi:hypothetical protein
MRDVDLLCMILSDFDTERSRSHLSDSVFTSLMFNQRLAFCGEARVGLAELIEDLTTQLSAANRFQRKCTAFKFIFNGSKIKRYKSRLKRSISLLSPSHENYTRYHSSSLMNASPPPSYNPVSRL